MEPSWKNQGNISIRVQRYSAPMWGKGYLSDLVMFFKIELPGKEDVSYGWEQYVKSLFQMQLRIENAKNNTKKGGED